MAERRAHPKDQSRLYKVTSPAQLSDRLLLKPGQLEQLLEADDNYIRWTDKKTGRDIQQPKPLLSAVHKRVATLLSRIETPDFLHSAIKGRSYISNADQHGSNHSTVKVDLRKFYPSTRAQAVFHFFRDRMMCDGDVSGILAKLLTCDGHLATGSSASPILSYFAYEDMFAEVESLASVRNCMMTCYVDDMVFTGTGASRQLVYDIIQIVRRYRLWAHKTKLFKPGQPKVITGVAVTRVGSRLPNQRQLTIKNDLLHLDSAADDKERLIIMRSLIGRLYEAAQIDPSWRSKANAIEGERKKIDNRVSQNASRT